MSEPKELKCILPAETMKAWREDIGEGRGEIRKRIEGIGGHLIGAADFSWPGRDCEILIRPVEK